MSRSVEPPGGRRTTIYDRCPKNPPNGLCPDPHSSLRHSPARRGPRPDEATAATVARRRGRRGRHRWWTSARSSTCRRTGRSALHPAVLRDLDLPTPFLVGDLAVLSTRCATLRRGDAAACGAFYAVKCNSAQPSPAHGRGRARRGSRSRRYGELEHAAGASASTLARCSTATPSSRPSHIAAAAAAGRVAVRLRLGGRARQDRAAWRPAARCTCGVRVDDSGSVVPAVAQVRRRGPPRPRAAAAGARTWGCSRTA